MFLNLEVVDTASEMGGVEAYDGVRDGVRDGLQSNASDYAYPHKMNNTVERSAVEFNDYCDDNQTARLYVFRVM